MQKLALLRRGRDEFMVSLHPAPGAGAVVINCPGYRGSVDGYANKYVTLGAHMAASGLAAVVRMPNIERPLNEYRHGLLNDMRTVIAWTVQVAPALTGKTHPELYLMGFSAGAFAAASVAGEFPQVRKILLMEPAINEAIVGTLDLSLARFKGDAYIVVGDVNAVGPAAAEAYRRALSGAAKVDVVALTDCDHQFTGRRNGHILAKAPFWAFGNDATFPSPEGGLYLYD